MATICCVTVLISIFLCYQFLFKHEDAFSKRTAKLYRSLLNMLVIDLCVAGFTGKFFGGLSFGKLGFSFGVCNEKMFSPQKCR